MQSTILGNINKILDINGEIVVEYRYLDAWGNFEIILDTTDNLGVINPFKYKGYYYDEETNLYYLKSRYYDSIIKRFISMDDYNYLDSNNYNGLNLYAYCLNNPVMYYDPSGCLAISTMLLISIGVGFLIGAGSSAVCQGIEKGFDDINWLQVGLDGVIGGIGGALAMSGLGVWSLTGIGAGLGFVGSVGGHLISGSDFSALNTWIDVGVSTLIGGVAGFVGGNGARFAKDLNNAKHTKQFIKAAASYDKVLSKISSGAYKNLAGSAGARSITSKALSVAWNNMVEINVSKSLAKALTKSGVSLFLLSSLKGHCSYIYL